MQYEEDESKDLHLNANNAKVVDDSVEAPILGRPSNLAGRNEEANESSGVSSSEMN